MPAALDHAQLAQLIDAARARLLAAVDDLGDAQLEVPELPTINPLRWELGHIAFFWDQFVRGELGLGEPLLADAAKLYDSFDVAHDERWGLPLPHRVETMAYLERVRDAVHSQLAAMAEHARTSDLVQLASCHEDMHVEALLVARQTLGYPSPARPSQDPVREHDVAEGDLAFDGGELVLGTTGDAFFSFDNERPPVRLRLEPFAIARRLVTRGAFVDFVSDGGYADERLWSRQGWVWRSRLGRKQPRYYQQRDGAWHEHLFGRWVLLERSRPAMHIAWHEAVAYCAWAGRRLPSEAQWEMAARSGRGEQWDGSVWQWTSDPFYPFPGYVVDEPYREYSAPWFGYPKVLKGGSWASPPSLARPGFRNFFRPDRDDVFAGFRTCST
jgi:ergothioneine biosynthesis protein EgtB